MTSNSTAQRISEGKLDPYVKLRIVGRIAQGPVRDLLPAVVLLRRFNAGHAGRRSPAIRRTPGGFPRVERSRMAGYRRDPDTDDIWLEVDPNLYPKLLAYFEATDPAGMEALRRDLVRGWLRACGCSSPAATERAETIAACLVLLPATEGVQLWSEIEWRAPVEADWSWLSNVARLAQGAEADTGREERPLLAAALAGRAGGRRQPPVPSGRPGPVLAEHGRTVGIAAASGAGCAPGGVAGRPRGRGAGRGRHPQRLCRGQLA